MSGSIEDSIIIFSSAFEWLEYVIVAEVCEGNEASLEYIVGKGRLP